ncbi:MAG TPA: Na+/H+ antiporter subunit E [Gaiellaceae bacterium]
MLVLALWSFAVWLLLTWTITIEQEAFGVGISLVVALCLSPFGGVIRPWLILDPRRLWALVRLIVESLGRILVANIKLAYRIWAPSRPLKPGMVIVPTQERSDAGLTAVGLISSLIVDNQLVDLDRRHRGLQYHAVSVPGGDAERKRTAINGPLERLLRPLTGGGG